ncbi:MAG: DUF4248 domain-containing protein [Prevotellaceae bacterium]|nr:DUF4248 domain-containing protein [Prevotellaceae bacterium]
MTIKSYTKRELALMYFPNVDAHTATTRLARWIRRCEPLFEKLVSDNYKVKARILTRRQVALIIEYLGEP